MRRAACAEQLAEQLPQRNSRRATCTEHFAQLAQRKLHKALVQSNLRAGHVPKQLLRAYVRACVRAVAFFCWFVCVCACVCVCVCVCASCGSVRACVNEERTVILVFCLANHVLFSGKWVWVRGQVLMSNMVQLVARALVPRSFPNLHAEAKGSLRLRAAQTGCDLLVIGSHTARTGAVTRMIRSSAWRRSCSTSFSTQRKPEV